MEKTSSSFPGNFKKFWLKLGPRWASVGNSFYRTSSPDSYSIITLISATAPISVRRGPHTKSFKVKTLFILVLKLKKKLLEERGKKNLNDWHVELKHSLKSESSLTRLNNCSEMNKDLLYYWQGKLDSQVFWLTLSACEDKQASWTYPIAGLGKLYMSPVVKLIEPLLFNKLMVKLTM